MLDHKTLRRIIKCWTFIKVSIGVLSFAGAWWAINTIVEHSRRKPMDENPSFAAMAGTGPNTTRTVTSETPKLRPDPATRSAEAEAMLARINGASAPPAAANEPAAPPASAATSTAEVQPQPVKPVVVAASIPRANTDTAVSQTGSSAFEAKSDNKNPAGSDLPVSIQPLDADALEVTQARAVLDRYQSAKGWWDRMRMVRAPGVIASLAHHHYDLLQLTDPPLDRFLGAVRFDVGDESFVQLTFLSDARFSHTVRANFLLPAHGDPQLDWESFAAYSEIKWTELLKTKPAKAVLLRGYVALDDYYNFEFSDRKKFVCAKITSPDGLESVFGYAERNTGTADTLERITAKFAVMPFDGPLPVATVPVTLKLEFLKDSQADKCARIAQVIANRWVLTEAEQAEVLK